MEKHEINGEEAPATAAAIADSGGGDGSLLGATQQLIDHEDGRLQAVAAAGEGGGGLRGALQQLIDLGDRRLQAASFFLVWGCCMLTNATVMNPTANVEHKFLGFVVLTIGAWLTLLTFLTIVFLAHFPTVGEIYVMIKKRFFGGYDSTEEES